MQLPRQELAPPATNAWYESGWLPAFGGLCALVVVMGIGRFAYTVLLPGMMETHAFDEKVAGIMAAWNYAGYLAGVLAMRNEKPGRRRYMLFVFFLLASLVSTAGMGWVDTIALWHAMRFIAGFASGACFVLCSAIVLDTLIAVNRPVLAGWLYSGTGVGIALGGVSTPLLTATAGLNGAWIGMALLCLPLAIVALTGLRPTVNRTPALPPIASSTNKEEHRQRRQYHFLLAAYFLEGFGYIIGTTFLVTLVKAATQSPELANTAWIVTGCAAAVSAPLWRYAARRGYLSMLILAFLLQAVGVLLPAIFTAPVVILLGGLLLGGTFMGITVLSIQYGVALSGRPSAHTVAVLTAIYGVGQIIGPFIAGFSAQGKGFESAFVLSAVSLFLAAALLLASRRLQNKTEAL